MAFWDFLRLKPVAPVEAPQSIGVPVSGTPVANLGALVDDRPPAVQELDPKFSEIAAAPVQPVWREKKDSELRVFGHQDQDGQSSCVANSGRKAMRVNFAVNHKMFDLDFSSMDIYRRRANYPDGGMAMDDLFRIMGNGVTLYALAPSDGESEDFVNRFKRETYMARVAEVFKVGNGQGIYLPIGNIDAVASVIERTKKGVVLFYYFTQAEWSRVYPEVLYPGLGLRADSTLRHAVTAVDYTLRNGKKCLVIDDSALFAGLDRRFITEGFHTNRNFNAAYPMNFVFDAQEDDAAHKPQHFFGEDMSYSQQTTQVAWLQKCLQFDGTFPANIEVTTGATANYLGLTAQAVLAFQKKYSVASNAELDAIAGKKVGPSTRAKLNQLFA